MNRINAILGTSEACIATHPSDFCVALAALDASVHVEGQSGAREIPFAEFHRLPGDTPELDTNLKRDEIITAVELPPASFAANYSYLKIRDRLSYAFALVSVAAALKIEGGKISDARLALGGVAHKPWRRPEAEFALRGKPATEASFMEAANLLLEGATGYGHNDFKIGLGRRGDCSRSNAGSARHAAVAVGQKGALTMPRITRRVLLQSTAAIGLAKATRAAERTAAPAVPHARRSKKDLYRGADVPHRRPCEGHGRRQVRGGVRRARSRVRLRDRLAHHQGAHRSHRLQRSTAGTRRARSTHA